MRCVFLKRMGGDADGTIEIVMRSIKESGKVTETVLTSFEIENTEKSASVLIFPKLEIHLKEQVVYLNGKSIPMSHNEFFTLLYLSQHPNWVFSKDQIYEAVYHRDGAGVVDNVVCCLIHSLRKKIETEPKHPQYIQTVRGVGYKFTTPEE